MFAKRQQRYFTSTYNTFTYIKKRFIVISLKYILDLILSRHQSIMLISFLLLLSLVLFMPSGKNDDGDDNNGSSDEAETHHQPSSSTTPPTHTTPTQQVGDSNEQHIFTITAVVRQPSPLTVLYQHSEEMRRQNKNLTNLRNVAFVDLYKNKKVHEDKARRFAVDEWGLMRGGIYSTRFDKSPAQQYADIRRSILMRRVYHFAKLQFLKNQLNKTLIAIEEDQAANKTRGYPPLDLTRELDTIKHSTFLQVQETLGALMLPDNLANNSRLAMALTNNLLLTIDKKIEITGRIFQVLLNLLTDVEGIDLPAALRDAQAQLNALSSSTTSSNINNKNSVSSSSSTNSTSMVVDIETVEDLKAFAEPDEQPNLETGNKKNTHFNFSNPQQQDSGHGRINDDREEECISSSSISTKNMVLLDNNRRSIGGGSLSASSLATTQSPNSSSSSSVSTLTTTTTLSQITDKKEELLVVEQPKPDIAKVLSVDDEKSKVRVNNKITTAAVSSSSSSSLATTQQPLVTISGIGTTTMGEESGIKIDEQEALKLLSQPIDPKVKSNFLDLYKSIAVINELKILRTKAIRENNVDVLNFLNNENMGAWEKFLILNNNKPCTLKISSDDIDIQFLKVAELNMRYHKIIEDEMQKVHMQIADPAREEEQIFALTDMEDVQEFDKWVVMAGLYSTEYGLSDDESGGDDANELIVEQPKPDIAKVLSVGDEKAETTSSTAANVQSSPNTSGITITTTSAVSSSSLTKNEEEAIIKKQLQAYFTPFEISQILFREIEAGRGRQHWYSTLMPNMEISQEDPFATFMQQAAPSLHQDDKQQPVEKKHQQQPITITTNNDEEDDMNDPAFRAAIQASLQEEDDNKEEAANTRRTIPASLYSSSNKKTSNIVDEESLDVTSQLQHIYHEAKATENKEEQLIIECADLTEDEKLEALIASRKNKKLSMTTGAKKSTDYLEGDDDYLEGDDDYLEGDDDIDKANIQIAIQASLQDDKQQPVEKKHQQQPITITTNNDEEEDDMNDPAFRAAIQASLQEEDDNKEEARKTMSDPNFFTKMRELQKEEEEEEEDKKSYEEEHPQPHTTILQSVNATELAIDRLLDPNNSPNININTVISQPQQHTISNNDNSRLNLVFPYNNSKRSKEETPSKFSSELEQARQTFFLYPPSNNLPSLVARVNREDQQRRGSTGGKITIIIRDNDAILAQFRESAYAAIQRNRFHHSFVSRYVNHLRSVHQLDENEENMKYKIMDKLITKKEEKKEDEKKMVSKNNNELVISDLNKQLKINSSNNDITTTTTIVPKVKQQKKNTLRNLLQFYNPAVSRKRALLIINNPKTTTTTAVKVTEMQEKAVGENTKKNNKKVIIVEENSINNPQTTAVKVTEMQEKAVGENTKKNNKTLIIEDKDNPFFSKKYEVIEEEEPTSSSDEDDASENNNKKKIMPIMAQSMKLTISKNRRRVLVIKKKRMPLKERIARYSHIYNKFPPFLKKKLKLMELKAEASRFTKQREKENAGKKNKQSVERPVLINKTINGKTRIGDAIRKYRKNFVGGVIKKKRTIHKFLRTTFYKNKKDTHKSIRNISEQQQEQYRQNKIHNRRLVKTYIRNQHPDYVRSTFVTLKNYIYDFIFGGDNNTTENDEIQQRRQNNIYDHGFFNDLWLNSENSNNVDQRSSKLSTPVKRFLIVAGTVVCVYFINRLAKRIYKWWQVNGNSNSSRWQRIIRAIKNKKNV